MPSGVKAGGEICQQTVAVQLGVAAGPVDGAERFGEPLAQSGDLLVQADEGSRQEAGGGEDGGAGGPADVGRFGDGVSRAELAALDHEGVADQDGAVAVTVAVPGEDDVKERTGHGQAQILGEAGVGQHHPGIHVMMVFQHQLAQGRGRVDDTVSGSLVGGNAVERLRPHDRGDGNLAAMHIHDAQPVEQRCAAVGVHGVRAHRHRVQAGLEVVGPAVVARGEDVVERGEDLPFDVAAAEPVVTGAFEEVPAAGQQGRLAQLMKVGQQAVGAV